MGPQAGLQFIEAAPLWRTRKEGLVQLGRREPADTPDDDLFAFLVPLQSRARTYAESLIFLVGIIASKARFA